LHPTPCTLHPAPCTLHPTPYTLHPTPYTLHHAPPIPKRRLFRGVHLPMLHQVLGGHEPVIGGWGLGVRGFLQLGVRV
ncbi:hypothetical protein T484DRAFT_1622220, partial [Baffinella frigidus]